MTKDICELKIPLLNKAKLSFLCLMEDINLEGLGYTDDFLHIKISGKFMVAVDNNNIAEGIQTISKIKTTLKRF